MTKTPVNKRLRNRCVSPNPITICENLIANPVTDSKDKTMLAQTSMGTTVIIDLPPASRIRGMLHSLSFTSWKVGLEKIYVTRAIMQALVDTKIRE